MTILSGRAANCAKTDEPPLETSANAQPNTLAIIQERYTTLTPITLTANAYQNNRYGRFAHNDLLKTPLGRRWHATSHATRTNQQCAGFVHALTPTTQLWSLAMQHRTQIVYAHDAGYRR